MTDNPGSGGGKIRPRRAATSRKPYSRTPMQRKSFFSKVTDSFKSFLNPITPQWLSNRLGSDDNVQTSQTRIERDDNEPTTSRNHEEPLNQTNNNFKQQLSRPPLGNFKSSTVSLQYYVTPPGSPEETRPKEVICNQETGKEGLIKHLNISAKRAKLEGDTPLTSDSSFLRNEMNMLSTNDNASVASSSGRSSSVQVQNSQRGDLSDNETSMKPTWSSSMDSLPSNRTSSSRQQATMSSHKRPRFNPSVFGMPALGVTPPTDSHQSSFYDGPVQFGGANASGRSPYFATPYKIPSVTKVKVRHVNHQRTPIRTTSTSRSARIPIDESMSSTAKKILQTLEKMSSPLNDARKIPTITRTPSSFAAERSRRRNLAASTSQGPPTSGLSSPSSARLHRRSQFPANRSLLVRKNKERIEEDTVVKEVAKTSSIEVPDSKAISARGLPAPIASMSSSATIPKPKSQSPFQTPTTSGGGGKMKSQKRSSGHYTSMREDEDEEPPDLPNVALPVSALPSFNFKSGMTSTPAVQPDKNSKVGKQPEYNFSSPVAKTSHSEQTNYTTNTPKFQFSSPSSKGTSAGSDQETQKTVPEKIFNAGSKAGTPSLVFAPDPKVVSNVKATKRRSSIVSPESSQSGMRAAETLKKGSVMDVLGGSIGKPKSATSTSSEVKPALPLLKQAKTGWTCSVCMVPNEESDDSCVACTTPKPGQNKKEGSVCGTSSTSANSFKPTDFSSQKTTFSFGVPAKKDNDAIEAKNDNTNNFGAKFKKPKGSWECTSCLVPNDASSDSCEACQSAKPGSAGPTTAPAFKKTELTVSTTTQFKFGLPTSKTVTQSSIKLRESSGWGDLAKKPASTWECEVCMVPNPDERKTCEACNSPKPGTKKTLNTSFKYGESSSGLYKFGLPDPKPSDDSKATKEPAQESKVTSVSAIKPKSSEEPAKPAFSFGLPASKAPPTSDTTKTPAFGIAMKPEVTTSFSLPQKTTETVSTASNDKDSDVATSKPQGFISGILKADQASTSAPFKLAATSQPQGISFGANVASTAADTTKSTPPAAAPGNIGLFGKTNSPAPDKSTTAPAFGAPFASTQSTSLFGMKQLDKKGPEGKSENQKTSAAIFGSGATSTGFNMFAGSTGSTSKPEAPPSNTKPPFNFSSKPAEEKKPAPFGNSLDTKVAAPAFTSFSMTPKNQGTPQGEPAQQPAFGGFKAGLQAPSSQISAGNMFQSGSTPASKASPFGASSAQQPFSATAGSSSTPFGAPSTSTSGNIFSVNNSSKPAFDANAGSGGAFGSGSGASKSVFSGQTSSDTSNLPKPTFNFGGSASKNTANDNSSGGFHFGPPKSEQSASFQFGAGSQQSTNSQSSMGFNFGGAASSSKPAFNPAPTGSGGFSFGGSSSTGQSNGVFQFGAGNNQAGQQQQASDNNMFVFGVGGNTSSSASHGSSGPSGSQFSAAVTPFNFTGNQQTNAPAMGSGPNMFGAGAAPGGQNPFDQSRSTTPVQQQGGRRIRQARRKLRK